MPEQKMPEQEMPQPEKRLVGLDQFDDETLAQIASDNRNSDNEMTEEAKIAFQELAKRSGDDMRLRGKYLTLYANTLVNLAVRMGKSDVVRESLEAMAREISITAKVMESIKSYNKM